jgi:ABC-type amino acid transport substrate-binding protein
VQIMSALSISLSGLQAAGQRFEASARRVVAAGAEASAQAGNSLVAAASPAGGASGDGASQGGGQPTGSGRIGFAPDMASAMVDMMQAETSFKANARVAGRIGDMQKAYLDMMGSSDRR